MANWGMHPALAAATDVLRPMTEDALRADIWLWRARFFKSRSGAAKLIDEGRVRWSRGGASPATSGRRANPDRYASSSRSRVVTSSSPKKNTRALDGW